VYRVASEHDATYERLQCGKAESREKKEYYKRCYGVQSDAYHMVSGWIIRPKVMVGKE